MDRSAGTRIPPLWRAAGGPAHIIPRMGGLAGPTLSGLGSILPPRDRSHLPFREPHHARPTLARPAVGDTPARGAFGRGGGWPSANLPLTRHRHRDPRAVDQNSRTVARPGVDRRQLPAAGPTNASWPRAAADSAAGWRRHLEARRCAPRATRPAVRRVAVTADAARPRAGFALIRTTSSPISRPSLNRRSKSPTARSTSPAGAFLRGPSRW